MYRVLAFIALTLAIVLAWPTEALARDSRQRSAFMHTYPCPATGKTRGSCPGFVVDHIKPLCAGGEDRPRNMQWQTTTEAKVKDRAERKECRAIFNRPSSKAFEGFRHPSEQYTSGYAANSVPVNHTSAGIVLP